MRDTTPFADCPFALDDIAVIPLLSADPCFVFPVLFRTRGSGFGGGLHAEDLVTGVTSCSRIFLYSAGGYPGVPPDNLHRVAAGIYVRRLI